MPSDTVTVSQLGKEGANTRLPVGVGLGVAVILSGGLWALVFSAARALF